MYNLSKRILSILATFILFLGICLPITASALNATMTIRATEPQTDGTFQIQILISDCKFTVFQAAISYDSSAVRPVIAGTTTESETLSEVSNPGEDISTIPEMSDIRGAYVSNSLNRFLVAGFLITEKDATATPFLVYTLYFKKVSPSAESVNANIRLAELPQNAVIAGNEQTTGYAVTTQFEIPDSLLTSINSEQLPELETINIGDYIQMGKYYDEPILWRCVDIDENGPLMLSDKILSIKPFDAGCTNTSNNSSHSRAYENGFYRQLYGSSYWGDSNMRSWLNSTATDGNVAWQCDNPPTEDVVWKSNNHYATEKGFIADGNFTASERNTIKSVTQKSLLNAYEYTYPILNPNFHINATNIESVVQNYETAYSEQITDSMFLLDVKQISKVYQNSAILGTNYYIGKPTQKAVDNSEYKDDSLSSANYWYSWLRSPYADYLEGSFVRYVSPDGYVDYTSAYDDTLGIRPAFYLNLSSVLFTSGNGSVETPYIVADATSVVSGSINVNNSVSEKDVELVFTNLSTGKQYSIFTKRAEDISCSFNLLVAENVNYSVVVKRQGYVSYTKENIDFIEDVIFNAEIFPGDLDNNDTINVFDISRIIKNFGKPQSVMPVYDLNEDGVFNVDDISIIIANLGKHSIVE